MTLSFSTKINGTPNYFVPKIWMGLPFPDYQNKRKTYEYFYDAHVYDLGKPWDIPDGPINPKITTIREDASNRWRAGMDIHMVINNRTKNRFQFAPVMKCKRVQAIEIKQMLMTMSAYSITVDEKIFVVEVDGKRLNRFDIEVLAINDGFDSVEDFFSYFNKDFTGKIIHWTNLKY